MSPIVSYGQASKNSDSAALPRQILSNDSNELVFADQFPEVLEATAELLKDNTWLIAVTLSSTYDTPQRYADAWRVLNEQDTELGIRILGHDHASEQPFTRSGGAVKITKDQIVYVRAHMNTNGYGTVVYKGNVADGFNQDTVATEFGVALETMEPLPSGCAF